MTWMTMPNDFGWYFFTPTIADYDLAEPVSVEAHTACAAPTYYVACFKKGELRITPNMGYWFGPIKLSRPEQ